MHYSPLATGTGLFVLWYTLPAGSPPALVARVLIDCAGIAFLAILCCAVLANLCGTVRGALLGSRHAAGRHAMPRRRLSLRAR